MGKGPPGAKEIEKALRILHASLPYVVQRADHQGIWRTVDEVPGKDAAYARMTELLRDHASKSPSGSPRICMRVMPRNEADRLSEGIRIGRALANAEAAAQKRIDRCTILLAALCMPENL